MRDFMDWVFTEHPGTLGYGPAAVALAICLGVIATLGIGGYQVVTSAPS